MVDRNQVPTKILEKAIHVANLLFYGYKVTCDGKPLPISSNTVRQAVKYISLDQDSRNIWDDPDMLPAHKYQNIPQIDISTYERDYCTDGGTQKGPISIGVGTILISYAYSSRMIPGSNIKENHTKILHLYENDPSIDRFFQISHIDKLIDFITDNGVDVEFESDLCLLIFRDDCQTDILVNGKPSYDVSMSEVYKAFTFDSNIYVPYRQGWSKLLNITPFTRYMDHDEFDMIGIANTNIHLLDVSGVTSWDGESTKIENHGIEVEYMITDRVENMEYIGFKVRRLNGTHEEMGTVVLCPEERTTHQYYVVYTIKGINVHGIEFDMP